MAGVLLHGSPTSPDRSDSPSPSTSPTTASSTCPRLERSVSTASFNTTTSSISTPLDGNSLVEGVSKRRGYTRPQATVFADSARNRDSVMSLGTIAHLQYYFARTGLLDGKGAQLAKERREGEPRSASGTLGAQPLQQQQPQPQQYQLRTASGTVVSAQTLAFLDPQTALLESGRASPFSASPEMSALSTEAADEPQLLALPPTYSTYKKKNIYVASPPNLSVLRRELRESLEDARTVLQAQEAGDRAVAVGVAGGSPRSQAAQSQTLPAADDSGAPATQGWHEIEGLHILDLVTLAIRAAKNYYTSHDQPQRLYGICSERRIRADLFNVLETLKRVGSRNFAGGFRPRETQEILGWIANIESIVRKDERAERAEQERRESWMWLNGSCNGHEREREWVFLKSFEPKGANLPPWSELPEDGQPGPFLESLRDGVALVQLHNELVRGSWRQFGEIKSWHTDTLKPYRRMENLKFWIKAAQLRWDTQLDVDVSALVNDKGPEAWRGFDAAILKWCRAVREELTLEWKEHNQVATGEGPTVHVEVGGAADSRNDGNGTTHTGNVDPSDANVMNTTTSTITPPTTKDTTTASTSGVDGAAPAATPLDPPTDSTIPASGDSALAAEVAPAADAAAGPAAPAPTAPAVVDDGKAVDTHP